MKYFIDFEATQYNQEIISIGCVREDGESFYSLIKPLRLKNVTKFISSLTGITKEDLKKERNSDEVFSDFFDWVFQDNSFVEFYCYGNSDFDFLKKNLQSRTNNIKAQTILSLIISNLKDYGYVIKEKFDLIKSVSLKKLIEYFYPKEELIWHNALNDAKMLHMLYQAVESGKELNEDCIFLDYKKIPKVTIRDNLSPFNIIKRDGQDIEIFESIVEAVDYIKNQQCNQNNKTPCEDINIKKRILKSANNKEKYYGFTWGLAWKKLL